MYATPPTPHPHQSQLTSQIHWLCLVSNAWPYLGLSIILLVSNERWHINELANNVYTCGNWLLVTEQFTPKPRFPFFSGHTISHGACCQAPGITDMALSYLLGNRALEGAISDGIRSYIERCDRLDNFKFGTECWITSDAEARSVDEWKSFLWHIFCIAGNTDENAEYFGK